MSDLHRLRVLLLDVDGVLTDGSIYLTPSGESLRRFLIRDGTGIKWARHAGFTVGLFSGRADPTTQHRANQLGVTIVVDGITDKAVAFRGLCTAHGWDPLDVAYMGDDDPDLPVLTIAGLAASPADASPSVRNAVHAAHGHVSHLNGGQGCVRETVEWLLAARGELDRVRHLT